MRLIECVPNISEGRRLDVVRTIVDQLRARPGVRVLDVSSDWDHNRSVITMAGDARSLKDASMTLAAAAVELINLRTHQGAHPRIGALDVLPFVPLGSTSTHECIELAWDIGRLIASRLNVPVYLYELASRRPDRCRLEDIRRGQFEGLAAKMRDVDWWPDYGPAIPHLTAGATVVGARRLLVAYNVNLATEQLDVARRIARAVRTSSGGLPAVKALGVPLPHRGIVQVSMNLTDYQQTPIRVAYERVAREAEANGVEVLESEIIGLVPAAAMAGTTPDAIKLATFSEEKILENQLGRLT